MERIKENVCFVLLLRVPSLTSTLERKVRALRRYIVHDWYISHEWP